MKKIKLFMPILIMLGLLASCAEKSDKAKVVLMMPGFSSISVQWIVTGAKEYVAQHPDLNIDLVIMDGQNRQDLPLSQAETVVVQGPEVVALFPPSAAAAGGIIERFENANIPVLTVNAKPDDEVQARAVSYVGSDDYQAGVIQAEMAARDINYKGNFAIIHGGLGSPAQIFREQGYLATIKKYPDIKLVIQKDAPNWTTEQALNITEAWLQAGYKIDAILCNSDSIAMGALVAVENAQKVNSINVYGIDALPGALDAIKAGRLKGTVWQDMFQQGWSSVEASYKVAKKENVDRDIIIPFEEVNASNIDSFIERAKKRDELNAKYF